MNVAWEFSWNSRGILVAMALAGLLCSLARGWNGFGGLDGSGDESHDCSMVGSMDRSMEAEIVRWKDWMPSRRSALLPWVAILMSKSSASDDFGE